MPKVIIKSNGDRFRRAGIEFTRDGVEVDTDTLSDEQIQAINDESRLSVVGDIEAGGDKKPSTSTKIAKKGK